jgi:hypothetical protein
MERPSTLVEEDEWIFIDDPIPSQITPRGHGHDRLYLIPAGRLKPVGREIPLPPVDDL